LSYEEAETIFLQNNLSLISEQLNIESQKAELIQAKVWPNPELSVSEINLWKNPNMNSSPPFFGSFGENQQIALELNQPIPTAGKRRKLIALEKTKLEISEQYFEELLRELKLELRTKLLELNYIQKYSEIYNHLLENISINLRALKNQYEKGNISKSEYIRLKTHKLEVNKDFIELKNNTNQLQKDIKTFLSLPPNIEIIINEDKLIKDLESFKNISIEDMISIAKENRTDYKLALLEVDYSYKLLKYEKSQLVPDVAIGATYDRSGGVMPDFVGFGFSLDLPLFNINKAGIKKAKINMEMAENNKKQIVNNIENEIYFSYKLLQEALEFHGIIEFSEEEDLDILFNKYDENFKSRNISMLEYIDFVNTYLSTKKIILESEKELGQRIEEFKFYTGNIQ